MRAADSDRDLVVGILQEQHLSGRLDSDELEQRLERCLAAKSLAELRTITADLPTPDARPWAPPGSPVAHRSGQNVRRVLRNLASLVAILLLAIWALTNDGYFWPAWGWFGLGVPVGIDATLRWAARRRPAGAERRALGLWTLFAFLEGAFGAIWLLTAMSGPATYFWPVWPLLGFVAIAGTYSAVALGTLGRRVHHGRR